MIDTKKFLLLALLTAKSAIGATDAQQPQLRRGDVKDRDLSYYSDNFVYPTLAPSLSPTVDEVEPIRPPGWKGDGFRPVNQKIQQVGVSGKSGKEAFIEFNFVEYGSKGASKGSSNEIQFVTGFGKGGGKGGGTGSKGGGGGVQPINFNKGDSKGRTFNKKQKTVTVNFRPQQINNNNGKYWNGDGFVPIEPITPKPSRRPSRRPTPKPQYVQPIITDIPTVSPTLYYEPVLTPNPTRSTKKPSPAPIEYVDTTPPTPFYTDAGYSAPSGSAGGGMNNTPSMPELPGGTR